MIHGDMGGSEPQLMFRPLLRLASFYMYLSSVAAFETIGPA